LQIITPIPSNTPFVQYVQNLTTKAWGLWESVPALCADTWNGFYYLGARAGVVYIYDGTYDNTQLSTGVLGEPIKFRALTSFQVFESSHATYKRVGFIRTVGLTTTTLNLNVQAVYDYEINTLVPPPANAPPASGATWNSAVWNTDFWVGGIKGKSLPTGALGMGRAVAIAVNGEATDQISMLGWDITLTEGNVL